MRRPVQIAVTLALFAGAMQLVRLALQATVPPAVETASGLVGAPAVLAVVLAAGAGCGLYGYLGERRGRLSR